MSGEQSLQIRLYHAVSSRAANIFLSSDFIAMLLAWYDKVKDTPCEKGEGRLIASTPLESSGHIRATDSHGDIPVSRAEANLYISPDGTHIFDVTGIVESTGLLFYSSPFTIDAALSVKEN